MADRSHHRGTKVHIDLEVMGTAAWAVNPRTTRVHTVAPADYPRHQLNAMGALSCSTNLESSLILDYSADSPPLYSSVNEASALERGRSGDAVTRHMRARTDLTDIRTILQWLVDKKTRIDFSGLPGIPRGELMRLLGRLYRAEQRARPYLSLTLSADEMRDALTADEAK